MARTLGRRELLATAGTGIATAVAGCSLLGGPGHRPTLHREWVPATDEKLTVSAWNVAAVREHKSRLDWETYKHMSAHRPHLPSVATPDVSETVQRRPLRHLASRGDYGDVVADLEDRETWSRATSVGDFTVLHEDEGGQSVATDGEFLTSAYEDAPEDRTATLRRIIETGTDDRPSARQSLDSYDAILGHVQGDVVAVVAFPEPTSESRTTAHAKETTFEGEMSTLRHVTTFASAADADVETAKSIVDTDYEGPRDWHFETTANRVVATTSVPMGEL